MTRTIRAPAGAFAAAVALACACLAASAEPQPRQKLVLNAEPLFSYGSAELRAASRMALDEFARDVEVMTTGPIRLVGHADRLGSKTRNQILSEERADAVKAYLVSRGIGETRMRVESKGSTQPATHAGACGGDRSAMTIACLQPDRRVAVEVAGTRLLP